MNTEELEIVKSVIRRGKNTCEIAADLNISENFGRNYEKIEEGQNVIICTKMKKPNLQREELSWTFTQIVRNKNVLSLSGKKSHINDQRIIQNYPLFVQYSKISFHLKNISQTIDGKKKFIKHQLKAKLLSNDSKYIRRIDCLHR
ncbi:hypothetical protein RF11_11300 [Thelohanellus kitauei]|uniref:Uncharacterized protein n=1 Tax=Thelohanellus kitauei TaxID=669202 RepID=A0A0C2M2C7_THEKT|nr:hypothetical protein RF11_11300 [Thelohanellus kitauei]